MDATLHVEHVEDNEEEEAVSTACNWHLGRSHDPPPPCRRVRIEPVLRAFAERRNAAFGVRKRREDVGPSADDAAPPPGKDRGIHPMPHAVSVDVEHLKTIRERPYMVTDKSDGVRYILGMWRASNGEPLACMEDRAGRMWSIPLSAPPDMFDGEGTFADGELLWDTGPALRPSAAAIRPSTAAEDGGGRAVFLVFDIMCVAGQSTRAMSKSQRREITLKLFGDAEDRTALITGCIPMVAKRYVDKTDVRSLILSKEAAESRVASGLVSHGDDARIVPATRGLMYAIDGIILEPADQGVTVGTHWDQFKWKSIHTLDFRMEVCFVENKSSVFDEPRKASKRKRNRNVQTHIPVIQLQYRVFGTMFNAGGDGVPYAGMRVVFSTKKSPELSRMLKRWSKEMRKTGETTFSSIVECACYLPGSGPMRPAVPPVSKRQSARQSAEIVKEVEAIGRRTKGGNGGAGSKPASAASSASAATAEDIEKAAKAKAAKVKAAKAKAAKSKAAKAKAADQKEEEEDSEDDDRALEKPGVVRVDAFVIRERTEKKVPNNIVTLERTLRSMEYLVDIDMLADTCEAALADPDAADGGGDERK